MSSFTVKLNCDHQAFSEDITGEICRILSDLSKKIAKEGIIPSTEYSGLLRDVYGRRVGDWMYDPD